MIRASSQYKTFGPENLLGDKNHGWLSDVGDTHGTIEIELDKPISKLTLESGFHEYPDREDWGWHARPKRIKLDDGSEHELKDDMSHQDIVLSHPRNKVTLEITDIYPGSRFNVVGLRRIVCE